MILDIISSDITIGGEMEFAAVVAPPVTVAVAGPGGTPIRFINPLGRDAFRGGDNLILKSLQVSIPYGFGPGAGQTVVSPAWLLPGGLTVFIPEFGADSGTASRLTVPDLCNPLVFPDNGLLLEAPKNVANYTFCLTDAFFSMPVSMVNLPADLAGVTVKVQIHCVVEHTYAMFVAP